MEITQDFNHIAEDLTQDCSISINFPFIQDGKCIGLQVT